VGHGRLDDAQQWRRGWNACPDPVFRMTEQMDSRRFRFHQIKEASPIAAVLEGYVLLLNPTVPIIGEGEVANDA